MKRERTFLAKWKTEYEWLDLKQDPATGRELMFCKICRDYPNVADKTSSFFTGTDAFRKDNIQGHDNSKQHMKCVGKQKLEKCKAEAESKGEMYNGPIPSSFCKLTEEQQQEILKLFNTAYFVVKQEMSFLTFRYLIRLQIKNDLSFTSGSYQSDQACRRFISFIHKELEEQLLKKIKEAKVMSFLFDGSTDTSSKEIELIYVRILDHNGSPTNLYFRLTSIEDATAEGVFRAINRAFTEAGLANWLDKVVAMGSDGASVNVGKKKGVGALLRNEKEHVIVLHCVAHRLELGILDVAKNHKMLKYISDTMFLLYKHYHYSPKALRELHAIAEAMDVTCLKPVRSSGTRWTPHMCKALGILVKSFGSIMAHLENVSSNDYKASPEVKGRAKNIVKHFTDFDTLKFVHLLLDILEVIAELSLNFQKDHITLAGVLNCISAADMKLVELKVSSGKHLKELHNGIKLEPNGIFTYKGIDVSNVTSIDEIQNYGETQEEFIDKIIDAISNRIENETTDMPVLQAAAKITDTSEWPVDNKTSFATFGRQELETILKHFENLACVQECDKEKLLESEWPDFKMWVKKRHLNDWQKVFKHELLKEKYQNLLIIFEIILVIPMSTAECERGFSALKRIKTDWRSRLFVEMTHSLMNILQTGPSIEKYDATPAMMKWWGGGQRARRPNFSAEPESSDSEVDYEPNLQQCDFVMIDDDSTGDGSE